MNQEKTQIPFIHLGAQYRQIKPEIDAAIASVFEKHQFLRGSHVESFEKQFAKAIGVNACVALGNGTDALSISIKSLRCAKPFEVITPAWSWISSAETISLHGGKVVFADVEPDYFTIDTGKIEEKINARTAAIVVVHLYGGPANMDRIRALAQAYNLPIIEDCAQGHFSQFKEQYTGTFGRLASFSFYPTKNLGAYGDAGCIVTNDENLALTARRIANHGALQKNDHEIEGFNSRMDELQAAILSVKLKYIGAWTRARQEKAALYSKHLKGINQVTPPPVRPLSSHSFHLYVIRAERRDALKAYLRDNGIETIVHYPAALPNLPAYRYLDHKLEDFPVATMLSESVLSLPLYPELTDSAIAFICDRIKAFYSR